MFTVFFFYRDGEYIRRQSAMVVRRVFGHRLDSYLVTAGAMTRAVLYGFLITVLAQGLIAGVGYAILGVHGAVLLGAVTGILSAVPVLGTALVWGPLSIHLLITGHIWKGVVLLVWGALIVHPTDNVLRPLLISNATHVPFVIVMFGVIGGIAAWGLVGAFVGPVALTTGLAIWRNWATGEETRIAQPRDSNLKECTSGFPGVASQCNDQDQRGGRDTRGAEDDDGRYIFRSLHKD